MADLLLRGAVRLVGITVRWRETPMTGAVRDGGWGGSLTPVPHDRLTK